MGSAVGDVSLLLDHDQYSQGALGNFQDTLYGLEKVSREDRFAPEFPRILCARVLAPYGSSFEG